MKTVKLMTGSKKPVVVAKATTSGKYAFNISAEYSDLFKGFLSRHLESEAFDMLGKDVSELRALRFAVLWDIETRYKYKYMSFGLAHSNRTCRYVVSKAEVLALLSLLTPVTNVFFVELRTALHKALKQIV